MALKIYFPSAGQASRQDLFTQLIHGFEQAGLPYCLLAGYDQYPHNIPSDIDFMVAPQSNIKLPPLIASIAKAAGAKLVQHLQHESTASYYVLAKLHGAHITYLQPDSSSDYYRNGKRWLNAELVLENRRRHQNGFWIPSAGDAFSYYLIKKLDKNELNAVQVGELTRRYHEDSESCRDRLYKLLPFNDAALLEAALKGHHALIDPAWCKISTHLAEIKQAMHKNTLPVLWRERWSDLKAEAQRVMLRLREPTGLRIVFLGPDGSGKSTVIEAVMQELSQSFRNVEYRHLRPGKLKQTLKSMPVTNPHAKPVRNPLGSHLKLIHFWSQYFLGNWLWLYPRYIRSTLVVFDRYFQDLLADPKRYRYGGSRAFAKWLGRSLMQPDLVFILDAPAEVLQYRKQEVSLMESTRQREAYQLLINEFDRACIINTNRPVEQVIHDVLSQVLTFLETRTYQRLQLPNLDKDLLCKP